MNHKRLFHIQNINSFYVLLEIFMQFVAVEAKIWWNNKGSSFLNETLCM